MLDVEKVAGTPPGMVSKPPKKVRGKRASYDGRDRKHPLRVTVTSAERADIEAKATDAGLSVATYLRACATGRQVRSVFDHQTVGELVKVAGDLGRLGGLLKLWLVNQPGRGAPEIDVRRTLNGIGVLQAKLAEIVGRV